MAKEDIKYDVAVIGGGPAGIMASCIAAESGAKTILIERNKQLGKKLLLTGNGRCNLTNAEFNLRKLVESYGKGGEFLFHAFSVFGPKETVNFFEEIGVETKIENNKRVFPVRGKAEGVLKALEKYLAETNVEIIFDSEVVDVEFKNKKISKIILKEGEVTAKKYILCLGGKSYSLTGSDGIGYKIAEKLGHTIIKPKPALSPIKLKDLFIKDLQGISLEDIKVSVFQNGLPAQAGEKQVQEEGEIMFTHYGISGPAILNISGRVGELLDSGLPAQAGEVKICFDLFPLLNQEQLSKVFDDMLKKHPNKTIKNILSISLPERLAEVLSDIAVKDNKKIANNMSKPERLAVVKILKNFEVTAQELVGFEGAMVTKGGVSLKEIDHKTMKSKIIDNLFFAGEIIDIDGKTGGFNLQSCWSTGYLAGKSAGTK
ncbi:MAG: NAD(P)/FAD-dependent oxidoreductase [Candidatus Staskawiczbacteria bacterium]|nr:NAD(P)/FAD-dependent oxidoreductase [Candidatus Staskawiczbacteria bacterium]